MAQELGIHAALPDDPCLVPRTRELTTACYSSIRGSDTDFCPPWAPTQRETHIKVNKN